VGSSAQSVSRGGEESHPGLWHRKGESHPVFVTRDGMEGGGKVLKEECREQARAQSFILYGGKIKRSGCPVLFVRS
jgi:hypothetical protein